MSSEALRSFIKDEKSKGTPDIKIFLKIQDHPKFAMGIKKGNDQGLNNRQIAQGIGLNIPNPQEADQTKGGTALTEAKKAGKTKVWESALLGASDLGAGVVQGFTYAADGINKGVNKALGTNLDTESYDRFTKQRKDNEDFHNARREANGQGFDGWRLGGQVAATAPLAALSRGYQGAKILSQAGAKVAGQNALVGSGIGGASFAKDSDARLTHTTFGGVGGAVGGVIGKKIGDVAVKGLNATKKNMRPGAKEIIDEGKKHGVNMSVGDVGKNSIIQKAEVLNEQVPFFGTASFREAQQQQAKVAANKVVEKLHGKMSEVDYKSINKIQKAASNGDKNAIRIMGVVNEAGEDSGKILQAAAEIKNWRGQKVASSMYDRVSQQAGSTTVSPTKTIQAIDEVIASDSKVVPNKDLLKEISGIKDNLTNPAINTHFGELRAARSRLGELVDEWGRQGKSTSGLTKIRTAIDDDTADFALNSGKPSLINEYKRADAFYRDLQKSRDKALANSMNSNTPDEIFNNFVKVGKGDKAANFYQNLDPKGQAALRFEMANQALGKATNTSTDVFSPAKYAREFERLYEPYQNIFKGADRTEMDGFVKLMRHVERAGQYAENPPTGNRLVFGAISMASLPVAAKIALQASLVKVLFTTKAGRQILLASKDLPPNSQKLANLLKMAQKLAVTSSATATSNQ